jgi:GNAT superfamily N-acetyltransferase
MPKAKFADVDFSKIEVVKWTPNQAELGSGFRCLRQEFATFWRQGRIARECNAHIGRCWVVHHENNLAGYITLLADKLVLRRQILKSENVRYTTFPAVKIGLLAVDHRAKGVGTKLMRWAIAYAARDLSVTLGTRFMTVDAFYDPDTGYDVSPFYEGFGFEFSHKNRKLTPNQTYREMFHDIGPLIDLFHPELSTKPSKSV